MTFTYQIDEADFVSAGRLLQRTRRAAGLRRVLAVCSLLILGSGCALFLFHRDFSTAALFGVFFLLYVAIYPLVGWQYKRQFRKVPALHAPRSLEADANGLHLVSPLADARFAWQVLDRFAENERTFILVQQGGRVFFPISKRGLTPEQIAEFGALCAMHTPRR